MTTSTSSAELSVLDTNVLVYAHDQDSAYHQAAARLLANANDSDAGLCVTPQTLAEFFAVITSPKRVTNPRSAEEAVLAIERLLLYPGITLLPVPADVVSAGWTLFVASR
jgi:predicted nucleic acid-binding protein